MIGQVTKIILSKIVARSNHDIETGVFEVSDESLVAELLVGMGLLKGYELSTQGLAGGTVTLKAISNSIGQKFRIENLGDRIRTI